MNGLDDSDTDCLTSRLVLYIGLCIFFPGICRREVLWFTPADDTDVFADFLEWQGKNL